MKKEIKKLNKQLTKNNNKFQKFYNRSGLPYQQALDKWIADERKIEKILKVILLIIVILCIAVFVAAIIILRQGII